MMMYEDWLTMIDWFLRLMSIPAKFAPSTRPGRCDPICPQEPEQIMQSIEKHQDQMTTPMRLFHIIDIHARSWY